MVIGNVVRGTEPTTMRRGIGVSAILYLIYVSYSISGYSSQLHNYIQIALFAAWAYFALIEDKDTFKRAISNQTLLWAVLFLVYYFLTSLKNGDLINTMEYIAKYILSFSCVLQYRFYKSRNNQKEMKLIVVCTIVVWVSIAVNAIAFYITVPSAARTLASDFYAFDAIAIGGGYAIAVGSAILCVYLFERFINNNILKKSLKLILGVMVVILLYLLIKTESTLTLISCIVGLFSVVVRKIWRLDGRKNGFNKVVIFISLLSVLLLFISLLLFNFQEIGEWIIDVTKDGIDNTIVRRFNRIGQKMAYSGRRVGYENYIDSRFSYIVQSWETFLKNPIIGVGFKSGNIFANLENNGVAMHSAVCDLLAQHGIIGFIPFCVFFIKALKKECGVRYNTYVLTVLCLVIVNPFEYFHAYVAMFMLIPMMDILIERTGYCKAKIIPWQNNS